MANELGPMNTTWVFPKIGVPPNHLFNRVFHYKPSILGYHYFRKHPHGDSLCICGLPLMACDYKLKLLRKDSKYVNLRWVLASPGPISESDVELASTCPEGQRVMILGFNTQVSQNAERTAKDYLLICCLNIQYVK